MADEIQSIEVLPRDAGLRIRRLFTKDISSPLDGITWERRSSSIKNPDGSVVFEMHDIEVPSFWSQVATDILAQKYFRKAGVPQIDLNGSPILDSFGKPMLGSETSAKQIIHRLANCWRYWGEKYGYFATSEDAKTFYDEIIYMLVHQMAAPNSPQWFNTGLHLSYGITSPAQGHWYVDPETKEATQSKDAYSRPAAHACFIQSIRDDLVNEGGILDLAVREARVYKYGGGTGSNFSSLRGKGEPLSGGGSSSGLMSFLKIFDIVAGSIKSGGTTRRAAKMVILDLDHPEIEDFVTWKAREEKKVAALVAAGYPSDYEGEAYQTVSGQNSNNTVRIPNKFMQSLSNDGTWDLHWRTDGRTCKTLRSKDFWDRMCQATWASADPGVQFDDIINDWHTCPETGHIRATNPCSEFIFIDDTACNLASLNLMSFFDTERLVFNSDAFKHAVRLWTIVLEISVLMAQYPSKNIAINSYRTRSLGLGFANLGTMLMVTGIPYDSDEGRALCAGITAVMTGEAYATSAEIASFAGTFPEYERNREHMLRAVRNHRRVVYGANPEEFENLSVTPVVIDHKLCPQYLMNAAISSWDNALDLGEKYGYRNAQVSLLAPTGTIALLMDCDTTGIEPDFALVKFKKLAGGGYFKIVNHSVELALQNLGYTKSEITDILTYVLGTGTLRGAPYVNDLTLKRRGFSDDEIRAMEKGLVSAFDLSNAINKYVVGIDALERAGLKPVQYSDPNFNLLKALGFSDAEIDAANEHICGTMMIEGAPHLKTEHYPVFDCASRCGKKGTRFLAPMSHVRMMSVVQPLISGGISKTVNLQHEASVQDIQKIFFDSWMLGIKCIAVYRDGCKLSQPLSTSGSKQADKIVYKAIRKRLPDERRSITHKFRIGNQEGYITAGLYEDGKPGEIFMTMSKEGSAISGLMDSFATSVSIALQYGVPLRVLVNKFAHMRFEPSGPTDNPDIRIAKSIMDYIFRWLGMKFMSKEEQELCGILSETAGNGNNHNNHIGETKRDTKLDNPPSTPLTTFVKESEDDTEADDHSDAPPCHVCGSFMIRSGSCYLCLNCGATSGCV
jgi:ribonucleoside-diphosphate reductase alpha chain